MTPDRVKAIRAALGMTQSAFAEALGSNLRTVQRWEGGERSPRGASARMIEELGRKAARRRKR